MRYCLNKVKPYMGGYVRYTYGALAVMLAGLIAYAVPFFMVYRIIRPLLEGEKLSAGYYAVHTAIIFGCELAYSNLYVLGLKFSHISAYNTLKNIRISLQKKLERQPLGTIQDMGNGKIKKLFTDDIDQVELLLAHAIPEGIANLCMALIAMICMFFADWKLALLSLCSLPLGMFAMGMMFRTGMKRMNDYYAASAKMNSTIIEYVNGMEVVKVFGRDGESYQRYENDIRKIPLAALMDNISMVFQRVYLFQDTVYNNIALGRPDASREEVIEAAKKARCYDFITELPDGFDTVIGEGGASLSGGQAQRLSIARCILKDSPIVILDEATASVDADNESYIQQAISELCMGKTLLVIAHRLNTIAHADKIIVIKDGQIAESGDHQRLMDKGGIYCSMVTKRAVGAGWRN